MKPHAHSIFLYIRIGLLLLLPSLVLGETEFYRLSWRAGDVVDGGAHPADSDPSTAARLILHREI